MSRTIWIGNGWKMNKTLAEARAFAQQLAAFAADNELSLNLFTVPPFTALPTVCDILAPTPVKVGAQDMHWADSGAFTGDISPLMIKDAGAQIVELGHSERRAAYHEDDFAVNRKVRAALAHALIPLVCVGETAQEKDARASHETVARQVKIALHDVDPADIPTVILAYEPVWAIGTHGTPAEPSHAAAIHDTIRATVDDCGGTGAGDRITILYGGSVNATNAMSYLREPSVDGLFIGRAALDVSTLIAIIRDAHALIASYA